MRRYFLRIPRELEYAAYVAGEPAYLPCARVILPGWRCKGSMVVTHRPFNRRLLTSNSCSLQTFNSVHRNTIRCAGGAVNQFFGRERVLWKRAHGRQPRGQILPVLFVYVFLPEIHRCRADRRRGERSETVKTREDIHENQNPSSLVWFRLWRPWPAAAAAQEQPSASSNCGDGGERKRPRAATGP